jgi:hypothetical protein|tara:strand:- start:14 stop:301 length:288 start_codon:yes stop_codon:yes gene_type:complete
VPARRRDRIHEELAGDGARQRVHELVSADGRERPRGRIGRGVAREERAGRIEEAGRPGLRQRSRVVVVVVADGCRGGSATMMLRAVLYKRKSGWS